MKILKLLIFTLLLSGLFVSCKRHCGEFPDSLSRQWAPYKKGDILRFQSGVNQITFELDSAFKTRAYSEDIVWEEGCIAYNYMSTKKNHYPYLEAKVIVGDGKIVSILYTIWINTSSADIYTLRYNASNENDPRYKIKSDVLDTINLNLGTGILNNVYVLKNFREYDEYIKNIYLHREKGLVGFKDINEREYLLVE